MNTMPRRKLAIEIDDTRLVAIAPLERSTRGEIEITPIEAHQEEAVVRVYRDAASGYGLLTTFRLTRLTRFGRPRPVMRLATSIGRTGRLVITVHVGATLIARQTVDVSSYIGTRPSRAYLGVIVLVAIVLFGAFQVISRTSRAERTAPRGVEAARPETARQETARAEAARPETARVDPPAGSTALAAQPGPTPAPPMPEQVPAREIDRPEAVTDRSELVTAEPVRTLYFAADSAELSDIAIRELSAVLPRIADAIAAGRRVVIEGHCAPAGSPEFLLALSRDRADAVASFLVNAGLPAPDAVVGFGAERPITTDADRLHVNRRVEILLEPASGR